MRRFWSIGVLVGLACAVAGCAEALSQEHAPAVASVAGTEISQETFRRQYVDYLLSVGVQDAPSLRLHFLDILIADKLLAKDAHEAGRVDTAAYRHEEAVTRRKLLLDVYARQVLYDTLQVTEREVAEVFVRANTQLTVRHLYAPTREEAEALLARLQAGEPFEALAREVFADPTLANNGGLIGTVSFDELDPAFEEVAYRLEPGAISEPVKTAYGYSIIRVDERFSKPILTQTEYAQKRDKLERFVRRRKQVQARAEHARELGERLHLVFNEEALARLLGQITGRALITDDETFQVWLAEPLVTFGPSEQRRTWSVEQFRQQAQYTDPRQRAQVRTRGELEQFITGLVVRESLVAEARAQGFDQLPDYRAAVQQTMEDWVVQRERQRIRAEAPVPPDSIRAHYEAHPAQYQMLTLDEARSEIAKSLRLMYGRTHLEAHLDALRARYEDEILIDRDLVAAMPLIPSRKASS